MSKQLEENVNSLILNFLENGSFLENSLDESKLNFKYLKINDPILADNIFNFRIESYGQVELQEWDVVRSDEIVNMDELYMEKNNDIDGLTTKIFNFVGKKMNERVIHDPKLNESIPYLIDSIYDDFTKIIFNDYTKLDNNFFNEVLAVYLAGGWPCGWEGKYPEGRLIVFSNE